MTLLAQGVIALLLSPAAGPSRAAPERWSHLADTLFRHLTPEQGLPNTIATALAEDASGFIWVGTQGGLSRWDGYRFRTYVPDPESPGALPHLFVQTLHVDALGRLWVGTSGGLARYDPATDRFVSTLAGQGGLTDPTVLSIADDASSALWVATSGGLDRFDPTTGTVVHQDPASSGLPGGRVTAVLCDRRGALWAGTSSGLYRRAAGETTFASVAMPLPKGQAGGVARLLEDRAGHVWIGTRRSGAYRVKAGAAAAERALRPEWGVDDFATDNVGSLVEAAPGVVWIGTFGRGVVVVDEAAGQARRIRRDRALPPTLADDSVWALLRDRSGLVWAGTNRGVSLHNPAQTALQPVFAESSRSDGVTDGEIFSVATAADGRVWLGLGTRGALVVDPAGARSVAVLPDPARPESALPRDRVWSIAAGADGAVYLGTNRGLYRSDARAARVERLDVPGRSPVENTQCLLLDAGTLYLGGLAGGLWARDLVTGRSRQIGAAELRDEPLLTLAKGPATSAGRASRIWVATATNLVAVDAAEGRLVHVAPSDERARAMGLSGITSLLSDRQGRLWIGTDAGDLQVMAAGRTPDDPRLQRVGTGGGPIRGIAKLLEDEAGDIWASSDGGLLLIDGESLALRRFTSADGDAFTSGYWADSGAVTAPGELVFGALGGLTIVRPGRSTVRSYEPPVVVTDLRVGGVGWPAPPFVAGASMPAQERVLEIAPTANHVAVEFAALDYSAPERNRYAYRLDGVDGDWIASDPTRRLATYANLPPGRYALRLRGSNRDGEWARTETSLQLRVLPAWHETRLARLAAALAGLAGVYAIVAMRTAALRRRQRELEDKVGERTAQLEQASRALEQASLTDPLTGLRNRRFATQFLADDALLSIRRYETEADLDTASARADADLVFFLLDVDHFKRVNDVHGHAGGDALLVQMSARLRRLFRETDYLVRWGGEEFLLVARATLRAGAAERAERIRRSLADEPFRLPGEVALRVTCSIGFVAFPCVVSAPRAFSWEAAIELADRALYAAKQAGRDGWVGLAPGPLDWTEDRVARLQSAPAAAVARGELTFVSSQPSDAVMAALGR